MMGRVLQWNAHSMNAHGFEFYNNMIKNTGEEDKPSIVCIQETWYDEYNNIIFPDYMLITKNRKDRRGGLAFYVHKSINFQVLKIPEDREYQIIDIFIKTALFDSSICIILAKKSYLLCWMR